MSSLHGFVHSTERGSAVDGPGIRYLLFLSGCAFRCLYCHNPDTWKVQAGERREVGELVTEIGKYTEFLKRGGGVTVSGGEPLFQADFVQEFFLRVKAELGLHTCLDTNGHLAADLPDEWFDCVDLVLLDIKHIDDAKHKALTGFSNAPVLEFARRLSAMGKPLWIRHVLLPGHTDALEDVEALTEFVKSIEGVERVEILPFHQMGASKWKESGLNYALEGVPACTQAQAEAVRDVFRSQGIMVG
ncbi:MAG: pyruvate formate lyase-activating protein [Fibrobacterota bacterium]|jgi:pyruvate formate lyase activating enzyme